MKCKECGFVEIVSVTTAGKKCMIWMCAYCSKEGDTKKLVREIDNEEDNDG